MAHKEVEHEEYPEPSLRMRKLKRYMAITAILGIVVAAVSLILAIGLSMSSLLNGVPIGIIIAVASGLARVYERGLILRRTIGATMVIVPITSMFFGAPLLVPLMAAPGIIIAVFMLFSKRRGLRSGVIILAVAIIYAAVWLYGLFPGALIDGSWAVAIYQMWSPRFYYEAGQVNLVILWALQLEKTLALAAGAYLLLTALSSKVKAPPHWTTLAVVAASLLPLLLLAPPPTRGIEGGAVLKVTVLSIDDAPISKLEVDLGKEPGPPAEGGLIYSDVNGTATFYVKPGSYVVYFNAANFPEDLVYPKRVYQINVSEGKLNGIMIRMNYSKPGIAAPSGYSVWLTSAYDPNATHLTAMSSGEHFYIWVQGPKGDESEFSVYMPLGGEITKAMTRNLDPTGKPTKIDFNMSVGSPSYVTIEIRIQRKTVASVTVYIS